ncbi:sulfatase-like hydrolase/transferase [Photobacterium damselae subsp. piscicida]|nr:sulfatase-like hydrolase/transferase [Photobacterium damselae subsp. piscicida]
MGSLPHNRYKNALFYIDGLIAKVLKHIDLQNTIIVITSNHGQEFNDNKQNYWGHSSNYSDVQIHVPLYVYLPEHNGQVINYRTNHYDIMPTLMSKFFIAQRQPVITV